MKNTKQFYFQNGLSVVLQGLNAMLGEGTKYFKPIDLTSGTAWEFRTWSNTFLDGINKMTMRTTGGQEIYYYAFDVKPNKNYRLNVYYKNDMTQSNLYYFHDTTYAAMQLNCIYITNKIPERNGYPADVITRTDFFKAGGDYNLLTCDFNSSNNTKLYLAINFSCLLDEIVSNHWFKDVTIEEIP